MCKKQFSQKPSLKKHLKGHDKSSCSRCKGGGKVLSDLISLRAYILTHIEPMDRFKCSTCGMDYSSKKANMYHEMSHNHQLLHGDTQNFPCDGCSKKFIILTSKEEHVTYCPHDSDYKGVIKHLFGGFGRQYTYLKDCKWVGVTVKAIHVL